MTSTHSLLPAFSGGLLRNEVITHRVPPCPSCVPLDCYTVVVPGFVTSTPSYHFSVFPFSSFSLHFSHKVEMHKMYECVSRFVPSMKYSHMLRSSQTSLLTPADSSPDGGIVIVPSPIPGLYFTSFLLFPDDEEFILHQYLPGVLYYITITGSQKKNS